MARIRDHRRIAQVLNFKSLAWGRVSFTDIDAFMEIRNQAYIIIEAKHGKAPLPTGQRIALERLAFDLHVAGKQVLLIVARHETPADEHVDLGRATVDQWSMNGDGWEDGSSDVREMVENFLTLIGVEL